jgi:hypothetical protein
MTNIGLLITYEHSVNVIREKRVHKNIFSILRQWDTIQLISILNSSRYHGYPEVMKVHIFSFSDTDGPGHPL